MAENAQLIVGGKTYECPVIVGTEGERGIDITKLLASAGHIALDPGFGNTGSCLSKITFLDGDKGILRYRGYPIQDLADRITFTETAYLLIEGRLPKFSELSAFDRAFSEHMELSADMIKFFNGYPQHGHPMGLLSAMVCSLSGYYPGLLNLNPSPEQMHETIIQLLAKVNTIAAYCHKRLKDEQFVPPRQDLDYESNFLHMMFSTPKKDYKLDPAVVAAIRTLLVLHADHEQNCSTSTVRLVGSSKANLFASISAGICALWGPLHGGANQEVVEMLEDIHASGGDIKRYIEKAKSHDEKEKVRLMGFGHRVYKNYDPRAKIIKQRCMDIFDKLGVHDPLLDIALKLEDAVLKDSYFVERKLYPNVDFYSGLIYKAIGLPTVMFPVMFAIGRMPGWIAHWKEMRLDPTSRIGRPRQIYTGEKERVFVPISQR